VAKLPHEWHLCRASRGYIRESCRVFTTDTLATALADRYTIERLIGEGGMARVFLARDLRHNRRVALKVLRPDLGAVVGVERFQAEIEVTANLQHPNLLPLFDSGEAGDLLFYVMPYVEGESLRARIDREKQLPVEEAVRLASAVASALDYAHRHGVIHRDLKPENILLHEGQPLVADFGIALAISKASGARITQTGISLGTPQYMSPEQATGDRLIDGRTDIYSLGALTYEMLTGEPPHVGPTSQAVIARVLTERRRSLRATRPNVPAHVEAAVDQALEKLPADRWATAHDFAEALGGTRQITRTTTSAVTGLAEAATSRARRIRELAGWTLAVAFAGVAAWAVLAPPSTPAPLGARSEFEVDLDDGFSLPTAGAAASVALSRDGQTLVFVGQAKGAAHRMLYMRRLAERLVQEIRGTEDAVSPDFSPDGKEVLFLLRRKEGGAIVKRVDVAGGVARTLTDSGSVYDHFSWRDRTTIVTTGDSGSIALLNAENGTRYILRQPDRDHVFGFPDALPGSRAALITVRPKAGGLGSSMLGVVTIPEGKVTSLGIYGLSPHYSRVGGGHIVFATATQQLEAVAFDAARLRVTGTPVVVASDVGGGNRGAVPFAVADDGTLAFIQGRTTFTGDVQPVIVNRSGARRPIGVAAGIYIDPNVSPDGKQFAYRVGESTGNSIRSDIWRADISTGAAGRVTTNQSGSYPVWSRDGTEIYFSRGGLDNDEYVVGLTANAQPRIAFRAQGRLLSAAVGPAHGHAVFALQGPTSPDLWTVSLDSLDKPRAFAATSYREQMPRISPDGRFVAYESDRTSVNEIYIRPITGNAEEVKVSSGGGLDPVWSRDGRALFFISGAAVGSATAFGERIVDSTTRLMAAQVTTSPKIAVATVRTLFPLSPYLTILGRPCYDVFPNGEFLMLATRPDSTAARSTPLVVLTNWISPLGGRRAP
jgi:serine/threonine-protein kinase